MASKVVVHFEANGMPLRVDVDPGSKVDGIILLRDKLLDDFINKNGLKREKGLPHGLRVRRPDDKDVTDQVMASGFGPGVCYTIGVQVFCW